MSTHRVAFPLPPPTAPLFSNSPRKTSTSSALSSPAPPSPNNTFASRQRVDSAESTMSGHVTGDEQWADALSAVETGPLSSRDRSDSLSSFASTSTSSSAFSSDPSTAATSRSGSGTEDLLQCLGRGAVDLLERLESEREQVSPPRRRRRDMGVVEELVASNDLMRSPLAGSPVAGPSTYQATRRQHFPSSARKLAPSTSVSTLRSTATVSPADHARSASFTRTDISELDIESILDAYGDWGEEPVQVTGPPPLERTPRPRTNSSKSSIFPSRSKSTSSASSRSVRRELVFPAPALPSVEMDRSVPELPPHPSELPLPAGPYKELFPRHRVSPFPTKKKSSASLRSQAFPAATPPPVPAVAFPLPRHLVAPPSPLSSPEPSRRQPSVYSVDSQSSSSSPRSSARCSYQSSAGSSATGSFRWSISTSSTGSAPSTIAEEKSDWEGDRRGSVAASSCRSFGSSQPSRRPSVAGSLRSTKSAKALRPLSEMMDWTTFAEELENASNGDGDDEEGSSGDDRRRRTASIKLNKSCPAAPSAKSLRRAQSSKGLSSSNYSSSADLDIPAVPALPKKVSAFSLRHLRSSASLAAPTIPSRAGSLHKKAIAHGRDE